MLFCIIEFFYDLIISFYEKDFFIVLIIEEDI